VALLEAINDGAASIYAQRCGKPKEELAALMAAETWLTPEAAKTLGMADEITPGKAPPVPTMSFDVAKFGYRNVPPHIAAVSMQLAEQTPPRPTRETPAPARETNTMSYARIAMALGLASEGAEEAAVLAALASLNKQLQQRDVIMTELRQLTGKQVDVEMLGAVRGACDSAKMSATLTAKIEELDKKLQDSDRASLIAQDAADPKGRKLTPALVTHFSTRSAAELKAYLEVAPHVVTVTAAVSGGTSQQPAVSGGSGATSAPGATALMHNGKKWEDMSGAEKHNLHFDDADAYQAMLADYKSRRQSGGTVIALRK
jgi:hypothetical protein